MSRVDQLIAELQTLPRDDQCHVLEALTASLGHNGVGGAGPRLEEQYQQTLVNAGLLRQVKLRPRDQAMFERFQPVAIGGAPLSQTIIEERR